MDLLHHHTGFRMCWRSFLFFAALLFFAGCNTPGSRIAKNPALFASYSLSVQELIRAGEVDVGFSLDMVMMAVGKPNRTYTRTTRQGDREIWAYTTYRYESDRQLVDADFRYTDSNGIARSGHDRVWVNVQTKVEHDTLRIELVDDKVVAVERIE